MKKKDSVQDLLKQRYSDIIKISKFVFLEYNRNNRYKLQAA